eukprot:5501646-Prymnesium_polylepis.1
MDDISQRRYYQTNFERPSPYAVRKEKGNEGGRQGGFTPVQQSKTLNAATLRIAQPLKASIDSLTQEQIDKARMVKASRIAYEEGFQAAQTYLDEQGIPYDIDTSLSSKQSLVLIGDDGVKISYRGTHIKNVSDITADAAIAAGVESHHPQFKSAEEQFNLVTEKYGVPNELLGYSLGGNKAITMGNLKA